MINEAHVYLGERDRAVALDKATRIYDHLGPEFFDSPGCNTREQTIGWIYRTLRNDDLLVRFYDAKDAMLFKLMFV